jgi:dihydroxyacetone kinase
MAFSFGIRRPVKKLLGASTDNCVIDSLDGYVAVHPGLRLLNDHQTVVREDAQSIWGKVAVVICGGAGHEPFPAGMSSLFAMRIS